MALASTERPQKINQNCNEPFCWHQTPPSNEYVFVIGADWVWSAAPANHCCIYSDLDLTSAFPNTFGVSLFLFLNAVLDSNLFYDCNATFSTNLFDIFLPDQRFLTYKFGLFLTSEYFVHFFSSHRLAPPPHACGRHCRCMAANQTRQEGLEVQKNVGGELSRGTPPSLQGQGCKPFRHSQDDLFSLNINDAQLRS